MILKKEFPFLCCHVYVSDEFHQSQCLLRLHKFQFPSIYSSTYLYLIYE